MINSIKPELKKKPKTRHVIAKSEEGEHQESERCWCKPRLKMDPYTGNKSYIHNKKESVQT